MKEIKNLQIDLKTFKQFWDESLDGNYSHHADLLFLTRKIKTYDSSYMLNLSKHERKIYAHAELLYKILVAK